MHNETVGAMTSIPLASIASKVDLNLTMRIPIPSIAIFLALLGLFLASCGKNTPGNSTAPTSSANGLAWAKGEALVSNSNCTACHQASQIAIRRLSSAPAPIVLGEQGVGSRLSPPAIRERLSAHGAELGQRMPDLLHGVQDRESKIDDLVEYLASQGGPLRPTTTQTNEAMFSQGKALYREVGCTACHGAQPDFTQLASDWTAASLATFLEDPIQSHPSGRMPGMHLTNAEARALAAYLVSEQGNGPDGPLIDSQPGLRLEYFKGNYSPAGPIEETREPDSVMQVGSPELGPGKNQDHFGIRLSGTIEIPRTGRWSFWLRSDDGSRLYIDGELVIQHDGTHGASDKRGSLKLENGPHSILVTMFEASGGEELSLSWDGPGQARDRIPASAFSSDTTVLQPRWKPLTLNSERVSRGKKYFQTLGCTACHVPGDPLPPNIAKAPPFSSLTPEKGCAATKVAVGLPDYEFTAEERASINDVIANVEALDEPLLAPAAIKHTMVRLNCTACHSRTGVGGPDESMQALFISDENAELGDEGRLPPNLDDVGNKLRLSSLREVLLHGEKVRPYMKTRMPQFGAAQIEDLVVHFAAADAKASNGTEPQFTIEAAEIGRELAGSQGVSCIQCHTALGNPSLGVPAIDLADMYPRIRPGWFREHLLDPQKSNPGTRMTAFWGNGGTDRIFPQHFGGDPTKQVESIWAYLSLGASMPIPKGVVPEGGEYALIPSDDPIVIGVFMKDQSARTLAVGFPENAHYSWDMEHGRMATSWRGAFMDAEGTWHGRNANLQNPRGTDISILPPDHAIEILDSRTEPWPKISERDAAGRDSNRWQVRGIERDEERRPIFLLETDGVRIREHIVPKLASGGTKLVRRFIVHTDEGRGDLYMRAAVAPSISLSAGEGRNRRWQIGPGRTIDVRGAESFLREDPNGIKELLVKVPLVFAGREDASFEGIFEVEMDW